MLRLLRQSRYVALKITTAKATTTTSKESAICRYLASVAQQNSQSKYVTQLLDSFEIVGPNGNHSCLVFEPMGPSTASMVDELPCNKPRTFGKDSRYPKAMAKSILKQTLSALAFIHGNNVTHGDLQPGNVLFSLSQLDSAREDELLQPSNTLSEPVSRIDGTKDPGAPDYLALGQSLHHFVDIDAAPAVKLSDFGSGMDCPY